MIKLIDVCPMYDKQNLTPTGRPKKIKEKEILKNIVDVFNKVCGKDIWIQTRDGIERDSQNSTASFYLHGYEYFNKSKNIETISLGFSYESLFIDEPNKLLVVDGQAAIRLEE